MLGRDLVEVMDIERPPVLHLGVVEEIALDPGAGRGRVGRGRSAFDDAVDGDELDVVGIADQHVVKQNFPRA